ncbi:MAG: hypothetical protein AAF198_00880 [Pseudomonadota bacterium]
MNLSQYFRHALSTACVALFGTIAHADVAVLISSCQASNPQFPELCPCAIKNGLNAGIAEAELMQLASHQFIGVSQTAIAAWGPIFASCTASAVSGALGIDVNGTNTSSAAQPETGSAQTGEDGLGILQPLPKASDADPEVDYGTDEVNSPMTIAIESGSYGVGPIGVSLDVHETSYTMYDEGNAYHTGALSEIRKVGPKVLWVPNPNVPWGGNYYCGDPYPQGYTQNWVEPAWCSEWGWVSGEASGLYAPKGDRLRPQDYSLQDLVGQWFCQNCSQPWTITVFPDGTMLEAAANGSEPSSFDVTFLGGSALLRIGRESGNREVLLLKLGTGFFEMRYGSYPDQREGNLMLKSN